MPEAARVDDKDTGHGSFPARKIITGSPNVFINGKPAARVDDSLEPHTDGTDTHDGKIASGSSNVFVNGKPKAKKGDPITCGGTIAEGSSNVNVN